MNKLPLSPVHVILSVDRSTERDPRRPPRSSNYAWNLVFLEQQAALGRDMVTPVSRRWFGVLVRKAGGLEPHGVGPIRGINASETCVKGLVSDASETKPLVDA